MRLGQRLGTRPLAWPRPCESRCDGGGIRRGSTKRGGCPDPDFCDPDRRPRARDSLGILPAPTLGVTSATGRPVEGSSAGVDRAVLRIMSRLASYRGAGRSAGSSGRALVVALVALLPPVGLWARRLVVGEAVQFSLLAYVVPPLLVLGLAPATRERLAAWPALSRGAVNERRLAARPSASLGTRRVPAVSLRPTPGPPGTRRLRSGRGPGVDLALVVFVGLVAALAQRRGWSTLSPVGSRSSCSKPRRSWSRAAASGSISWTRARRSPVQAVRGG